MRRWIGAAVVLALVALLALGGQGKEAQAQPPTIEAREVRGQPVVVNGRHFKLWVFVFPEHQGKGKPGGGTPAYCTDGEQSTTVPQFAKAKPGGLSFNINDGSIPIDKAKATQAIKDSYATWDSVSAEAAYFTVSDTGGASRPAADGNNTIGWAFIVPTRVLAAAWVWVDPDTDTVVEADIFNNNWHKWGVFTTCGAEGKYEVGNIDTHEVGHVVALDHLSDSGAYATMYPTASKGEVRKRTLTEGDGAGYIAAGGK